MKFYNRNTELELLADIEKASEDAAKMTFLVGRRRIGKTSLMLKSVANKTFLYFFIAKKNEALLCEEFVEEIQNKLDIKIYGKLKSFKDVFGYLMEVSKTRAFTLIIDEFQEFYNTNSSVYSDMQNIWDSNKSESKMNLLLCGSVYTLMSKIFEKSKEPLFGRATNRLYIKEFDVHTLKEILSDHYPQYTNEDLLAFYSFTGGVAKYVELLIEAKTFTFEEILSNLLSENSIFIKEGKNVLIDEFGKDYGNYFSILALIASSKTSRTEIESILEMQTGGYLDRLEKDYKIIRKIRPAFSKPNSRTVKYEIIDNFLNFWFKFIYKNSSAVEIGNFDYLKQIVRRDYKSFSRKMLERYFIDKLSSEKTFSSLGTYWEKGNLNEIDIVAINEFEKKIVFFEVKRQEKKININLLKAKAKKLIPKYKNYNIQYTGLSMSDM